MTTEPRGEADHAPLTTRRTITPHGIRPSARLTGDEPLRPETDPRPGGDVLDFWRWSLSNLLDNTTRGLFAEYLVARALGCSDGHARVEWDAFDLTTPTGRRVEVKSVAFLQSWAQHGQPRTSVRVPETIAPGPGGTYGTEKRRHADVYVICVLDATIIDRVDPLDLDQWRFLVVPTTVLDERLGGQQSIALHLLAGIDGVIPCEYARLRETVEAIPRRTDPA